jgi:glycosyltransferase involved in cell wall biosynthesis
MIVRDEETILGRCLESVREHIDYWTIIDTGSSDSTALYATVALDGIPGQLLHRPWIDFGTNRTELLKEAHAKTDWILCLDADMTLDSIGEYPLTDAGLVRYTGSTDYAQALLLSGRKSWQYVGKTHEYVEAVTVGATTGPAPGWAVTHHADGASRADKGERDLAALLPEAEAGDARAMFYLARTFEDMGRFDDAVHWYKRRILAGGWDEERYCSQLAIGRIRMDANELRLALAMRPQRAEAWLYLSQVAFNEGHFDEAQLFAEQGMNAQYPGNEYLFVDRWIYRWGFRLERSVAAWWGGNHDLCREDTEILLADPELPDWLRARATENLAFCP